MQQKALVWNVSRQDSATAVGKHATAPQGVEFELRGHQRAISDLNWSPYLPEVLATCSYDTYVLLWDLRHPERPTMSFSGWTAGAQQVKFNKLNVISINLGTHFGVISRYRC